jgi:hypothetical protein
VAECSGDAGPGARVEQRAGRGLDPELAVERAVGVGDQRERQVGFVAEQVGGGGVEDGDLADARGRDLVVAAGDGPQVQVADRAAGEPAELEVEEAVGVGDRDRDAAEVGEGPGGDGVAHGEPAGGGAYGHGRSF